MQNRFREIGTDKCIPFSIPLFLYLYLSLSLSFHVKFALQFIWWANEILHCTNTRCHFNLQITIAAIRSEFLQMCVYCFLYIVRWMGFYFFFLHFVYLALSANVRLISMKYIMILLNEYVLESRLYPLVSICDYISKQKRDFKLISFSHHG